MGLRAPATPLPFQVHDRRAGDIEATYDAAGVGLEPVGGALHEDGALGAQGSAQVMGTGMAGEVAVWYVSLCLG